MAHLDELKFCQADNMRSRKGIAVKLSWSVIKDWAKILDKVGQVHAFILDFKKLSTHPFMIHLKVIYMAMLLVWRPWNG